MGWVESDLGKAVLNEILLSSPVGCFSSLLLLFRQFNDCQFLYYSVLPAWSCFSLVHILCFYSLLFILYALLAFS